MCWDDALATKEGLERHGWEAALAAAGNLAGVSLPAGRDLASA